MTDIAGKCLKIKYEKAEFDRIQGLKGYQRGKKVNGKYYKAVGFGWGEYYRSSKLILFVDINGEESEIWIDYFFKKNFGKLTETRRKVLKETMPAEIQLNKQISERGTEYFQAVENDLTAWLKKAKEKYDNT